MKWKMWSSSGLYYCLEKCKYKLQSPQDAWILLAVIRACFVNILCLWSAHANSFSQTSGRHWLGKKAWIMLLLTDGICSALHVFGATLQNNINKNGSKKQKKTHTYTDLQKACARKINKAHISTSLQQLHDISCVIHMTCSGTAWTMHSLVWKVRSPVCWESESADCAKIRQGPMKQDIAKGSYARWPWNDMRSKA